MRVAASERMPSGVLLSLLLCLAVQPSAASSYTLKHSNKICNDINDWKVNEFDENNVATNTEAGCAAACQAHGPECVEIVFSYSSLAANPTNQRGDCYLMKAGCTYSDNTRFNIYTVTPSAPPPATRRSTTPVVYSFGAATSAIRASKFSSNGFTSWINGGYFDWNNGATCKAANDATCASTGLCTGTTANGSPKPDEGTMFFQPAGAEGWLRKTLSGSGGVEVVYGLGCTDLAGTTEIKLGGVVVDSTTAFAKKWVGTFTNGQVLSIEEGGLGNVQIFSIKICSGGPCSPPAPPASPPPTFTKTLNGVEWHLLMKLCATSPFPACRESPPL